RVQAVPAAGDLVVGVDLGGTNIRVAVYRGLDRLRADREVAGEFGPPPQPLVTHREKVGEERSPDNMADRLARIIGDLLDAAECGDAIVPVGIGIAGMLRGFDGVMGNSPHLGWRDVPFGAILHRRMSDNRPSWLFNDVNAITYGEFALGAGVGVDDMLAVYVGTGIGGGLVLGGRLVEGASNCAGEIGHFKVMFGEDAPLCACGLRGCVEAIIGGRYLQARIRRELSAGIESLAVTMAGGDPDTVNPGHVDQAAAEGDDYALDLYAEVAPPLACTLGNAINLLNPARLILGGGMLSRTPVLREHVVAALELTATRALLDEVEVVDAMLGDDAGLVGSALLACERHAERVAHEEKS
ncbi:MAG: ROK family protein, partial [Myxococcota bacterium]